MCTQSHNNNLPGWSIVFTKFFQTPLYSKYLPNLQEWSMVFCLSLQAKSTFWTFGAWTLKRPSTNATKSANIFKQNPIWFLPDIIGNLGKSSLAIWSYWEFYVLESKAHFRFNWLSLNRWVKKKYYNLYHELFSKNNMIYTA